MSTTNAPKPIDREWLRRMADAEEGCASISVGGLAADLGMVRRPDRTAGGVEAVSAAVALSKLVQLWRRKNRMDVSQFARHANLAEVEVVGVESGELVPEPRVLFQLSQAIKVSYDKLMLVAGHVVERDERLAIGAVRFAARSEPMEKLTREEEEALHEFINLLAQ